MTFGLRLTIGAIVGVAAGVWMMLAGEARAGAGLNSSLILYALPAMLAGMLAAPRFGAAGRDGWLRSYGAALAVVLLTGPLMLIGFMLWSAFGGVRDGPVLELWRFIPIAPIYGVVLVASTLRAFAAWVLIVAVIHHAARALRRAYG